MKKICNKILIGLLCTGMVHGQIKNQTSLASHFVSLTSGGNMDNGPHFQHLLSMDLGKGFSGFLWGNYDLGMRDGMKWNEVDVGVSKKVDLKKNVEGQIGYQHWEIPNERLNFLNLGIEYKGKFNLGIDWKNPLGTGSSLIFKMDKNLGKFNLETHLGHLMNFFDENGWSYLSLGTDYNKKRWKVGLKYHQALMKTKNNLLHGYVSFNWN